SDDALTIGGWSPRNYGGRFHGTVTLAEALAGSYNAAAVRLLDRIGTRRLHDMARRLGITAPLGHDLSLALGTAELSMLELTAAYATIANGGQSIWPYAITQIREKGGRVIYRHKPEKGSAVVNRSVARALTGMLQKVVTQGTGKLAALDRPVAGKTGTTQGFRDAWFVGYTADYVGAVWLGNDNNRAMDRIEDEEITGGSLPAETWAKIMTSAHKGLPARALPEIGAIPSVVSTAPVAQAPAGDRYTGQSTEGEDLLGSFIENLTDGSGDSFEDSSSNGAERAPAGPRWD
ncbi:MAG: penicillin-binding transpeptidase domain-containing protein, partial [Pseudomonadota bacterium]